MYRIMKYPQANLLVVRKVFGTLKDSCYTEFKVGYPPFWCR
ncbi:MAG: hypothetical protein ACLUE7_05565 [Lachnospirales bacterium]